MVRIITCEGLPSANKDMLCELIERRMGSDIRCPSGTGVGRAEPCLEPGLFATLLHHAKTLRNMQRSQTIVLRDWFTCIPDAMMHDLYETCKRCLLSKFDIEIDTEILVHIQANIHESMMYTMNQSHEAFHNVFMGDLMAMFDALEHRKKGKIAFTIKTPCFMTDNSFEQKVSVQAACLFIEKHLPVRPNLEP
jgi:hypothetical protein